MLIHFTIVRILFLQSFILALSINRVYILFGNARIYGDNMDAISSRTAHN